MGVSDDELNKAMAHKVMGWHKGEFTEYVNDEPSETWMNDSDDIQTYYDGFRPATNANDALRVVSKMREKGWAYSIMGLTVQFYGKSTADLKVYRQTADSVMTLPRAICDAAYQAEAVAKAVKNGE